MTLEGSVDQYLSKQKTCRIPNIYEYPVTREKDDLKKISFPRKTKYSGQRVGVTFCFNYHVNN